MVNVYGQLWYCNDTMIAISYNHGLLLDRYLKPCLQLSNIKEQT